MTTVLFLTAFMSFSVSAKAEVKTTPSVIGIINLAQIQAKSLAVKDARKKREKYMAKYQSEAAAEDKELKKLHEDLEKQRNILSPDAIKEKEKEFKVKFISYKKKFTIKRKNIEKAYIKATNIIMKKHLVPIIAKVGKEHGINIVLNNVQAVFFDPSMDMTSEIIKHLNKKVSSVKFPDPEKIEKGSK